MDSQPVQFPRTSWLSSLSTEGPNRSTTAELPWIPDNCGPTNIGNSKKRGHLPDPTTTDSEGAPHLLGNDGVVLLLDLELWALGKTAL